MRLTSFLQGVVVVKGVPAVLLLALAGAAWAAGGGEPGGITETKITDFIWRSFNFVVFAAILIKLAVKPAKAFFAGRTQEIAQNLEDLESKKAAAAQALAEAEARLAQVGAERDGIIKQFMSEGEAEKAKIIAKAEMVAVRIKEMAKLTIEGETKKAAQELKREVAEQATQMAEELIKKKITSGDQKRLVEEYLTKVVQKH